MNELIAIKTQAIGSAICQTVNARDLHEALVSQKDFTNWIKQQIDRAFLIENSDFAIFALKGENPGRPRIEYLLTVDAAKNIAMMSGTQRGQEVRSYFIECERRAHAPVDVQGATDPQGRSPGPHCRRHRHLLPARYRQAAERAAYAPAALDASQRLDLPPQWLLGLA